MLSQFPILYSYDLAVPLVFRAAAGIIFLVFAYKNIMSGQGDKAAVLERFNLRPGRLWLRAIAAIEVIGGVFLIVGFYLQFSALALSLFLIAALIAKSKGAEIITPSLGFLFLLFLITVSLLFLGPGFYSIDLPL